MGTGSLDLVPLNHQSDAKENILDGLGIFISVLGLSYVLDECKDFLFMVKIIPYVKSL
jgi:hypothetical protein